MDDFEEADRKLKLLNEKVKTQETLFRNKMSFSSSMNHMMEDGEFNQATVAFVTFRSMEGKKRALKAFQMRPL